MALNRILQLLFICIITALSGCKTQDVPHTQTPAGIKDKLSNEISLQVVKKLMKEHELLPCGFGGGAINQIRMLSLSFNYRKPLTIEEGRKLVLIATHTFADAINADERIHPYLIEYPFPLERVEITIFVQEINGNLLKNSEADIFSCYKNICKYEKINDKKTGLITILQETVEEAEHKIKTYVSQSKTNF